MSVVQCRVEIPKNPGEDNVNLTVGKVFHLLCDGEWPVMKPESIELRLDKEDQYKLKLLKFDFTSKTQGDLTVTSYRPGQHLLKAVQLVDHDQSVVLGDLSFTVASVINPQEPVSEPYGPMGPFQLKLPLWYPLTGILVIAALVGTFFYRWKLRRDKQRLLAEMRLSDSAQAPYFQFYAVLRKLQRNYSFFSGAVPSQEETSNFVNELGSAYKIYLARNFEVPTLKWSERKIFSDLKRNHKSFYEEFRGDLKKAFAEISRAQKDIAKMSGKDSQQLLDLLRKQIDQMEAWVKRRGQ